MSALSAESIDADVVLVAALLLLTAAEITLSVEAEASAFAVPRAILLPLTRNDAERILTRVCVARGLGVGGGCGSNVVVGVGGVMVGVPASLDAVSEENASASSLSKAWLARTTAGAMAAGKGGMIVGGGAGGRAA